MSEFKAVRSVGTGKTSLKLHQPLSARKTQLDIAYLPAPGLREAADAAMILGAPLLLTGEPGTGKTSAAYWLAAELGAPDPLVHNVKSASSARNLLYDFDEVARFRDSSRNETRPLIEYLSLNALGEAIVRAAGGDAPLTDYAGREPRPDVLEKAFGADQLDPKIASLLPHDADFRQAKPKHFLVLLDELDKASRDTPNDLLAEIDNMEFKIPELGLVVATRDGTRPIVLMTSNSEKSLPEPFLRRCAFFDIPFPDDDDLEAILVGSLSTLSAGDPMLRSLMVAFKDIRDNSQIAKKPSTSEFIAWVDVIIQSKAMRRDQALESVLKNDENALDHTLTALLKTREDEKLGRAILKKRA